MTSMEGVRSIYELALSKALHEQALKKLNIELSSAQMETAEAMDEEQVDSVEYKGITFKRDTIRTFALGDSASARKWDDCEEWFNWLLERGLDGNIKTKKSVHAGTRNKILREFMDENPEEHLPDFITEGYFETVKFNNSAIKRDALGEE